jgi:hypothetical protein
MRLLSTFFGEVTLLFCRIKALILLEIGTAQRTLVVKLKGLEEVCLLAEADDPEVIKEDLDVPIGF